MSLDPTKVVVTGFGAFLDVDYNPSWDCAVAFADAMASPTLSSGDGRPHLNRPRLLDVSFDAVAEFASTLEEDQTLFAFGVARNREHVCLERFAHNWFAEPAERPARLAEGGSAALESALPLDDWRERCAPINGLEWTITHSAGMYVCNALYYHALTKLESGHAVFVHVPRVSADTAARLGQELAHAVTGDGT